MADKPYQIDPKTISNPCVATLEKTADGRTRISIRTNPSRWTQYIWIPSLIFAAGVGVPLLFRAWFLFTGGSLYLMSNCLSLAWLVQSLGLGVYHIHLNPHRRAIETSLWALSVRSIPLERIKGVELSRSLKWPTGEPALIIILKSGWRVILIDSKIGIEAKRACAVAIAEYIGIEPDPEWLTNTKPLTPYPRPNL